MPELPEVETVMRGLRARLQGRVIRQAAVHRADMRWAFPPGLVARLTGATVTGFRRRAKYILMRLSGGDSVLIHLGMSGRMLITSARPNSVGLHEHFSLDTDEGWHVGFVDPRRFGSVDLVATAAEDAHRLLADLGPEPLDDAFTAETLSAALAGRRTPIKAALLDQGTVAGLGNIYVCEALHRARISPKRQASTIATKAGAPNARAEALVGAIKAVLEDAIKAGGSSLRDHRQTDGELGYFQHHFGVYDREGEKCVTPGCDGTVKRIVQSGRSTFFCPVCQK
jgi:formamidopyrimidine-DNA glycosylase